MDEMRGEESLRNTSVNSELKVYLRSIVVLGARVADDKEKQKRSYDKSRSCKDLVSSADPAPSNGLLLSVPGLPEILRKGMRNGNEVKE